MYPTPEVTAFIEEQFIPVRVHVKEQPAAWHRFGIRWTPTVMVLAPDGSEVRREEGFLPADELRGWLMTSLGYLAANRKDWKTAEHWFAEAARLSGTEAEPEAVYWEGVARYSASHDHKILGELNRTITQRFPHSTWAKRTSVWKAG